MTDRVSDHRPLELYHVAPIVPARDPDGAETRINQELKPTLLRLTPALAGPQIQKGGPFLSRLPRPRSGSLDRAERLLQLGFGDRLPGRLGRAENLQIVDLGLGHRRQREVPVGPPAGSASTRLRIRRYLSRERQSAPPSTVSQA